MKHLELKLGALLVSGIAALAVLAPFLSPYDPRAISLAEELRRPGPAHLLGCDANGSDILSVILAGARVSLEVGVSVTLASVLIGLVMGSIAGYFGGWRDALLTRVLDVVFAFPGILLAIALASVLGPSKGNLILCLTLTSWAGYARMVRGEVLALRGQEFVVAARALGLRTPRIFIFHLWPNLASPLLVTATFGLAGTVLAEASLSFLGIGVPPGTPSWGGLLSFGRDVLIEAPHVAAFPGVAIMITVLGFHLLGEGLRRRLDPKA
ncbi:MAG: ABC transporter permease [Proteobacteria bacterium]|nr:MAG: ABC transporter permease [Pseudomonadota bacterium]